MDDLLTKVFSCGCEARVVPVVVAVVFSAALVNVQSERISTHAQVARWTLAVRPIPIRLRPMIFVLSSPSSSPLPSAISALPLPPAVRRSARDVAPS